MRTASPFECWPNADTTVYLSRANPPRKVILAASVHWISRDGVLPHPNIKLLEPQCPRFIQTNEKSEGLQVRRTPADIIR
jgi:hypothetical protein